MSRNQAAAANPTASWAVLHHLAMSLLKGIIGLLFDSRALVADALYSVSEAAEVIPEGRRSLRPAGGRMAVRIGLITVVMLGSLLTVIASAIDIADGETEAPAYWAGAVILFTLIAKEAYFRYRYQEAAKKSREEALLLIDNHRLSLWSSVISLIGIIGAVTGYVFSIPVLLYLDPAAAFIIAGLIGWKIWTLFNRSASRLSFPLLQEEDAQPFVETIQRVQGIITVDQLQAREQGHYISISAIITVNPRITVMEANDIAVRAKALLMSRFTHISEVSIQFMPYDPGYPYKSNYEGSGDDLPNLLQ
ncbi:MULTISPECIES: cation diffusion facilitator family transporter [Paenibacillus]|uniref:Cation diffusion facilitator transporter n=1 Tax=Paenibacillus apis TaxID=1792174 RepID=A0A919Y7P8_9BACL|nr:MULTISPECIES: cation transporter dimerization domain-containing protein [Paenibacillus]GIO44738.1 cation diffusion facilitator transporter [Paenibacillus apis]